MNYRTYADMTRLIRANLSSLADEGFDLVVGIPRSGMVPAAMIALYLNTSVCSLPELLADRDISRQSYREIKGAMARPSEAKKILIVDDSWDHGVRMTEHIASIPDAIRQRCKSLVVFTASESPQVDYWLEYVPQTRCFEWNIMHHPSIVPCSCFDLDGVLCDDPTPEQNDDGPKYLDFVRNAKPKFIPTYPVAKIVSSRLEKYRGETEAWLEKHGVQYGSLALLDGVTAQERREQGLHVPFKAAEYAREPFALFFESERWQAERINQLTGKPVYCVADNVMLLGPVIPDAIPLSTGLDSEQQLPPQRNRFKERTREFVKHHRLLYGIAKPPIDILRRFRETLRK
jgi:uncharacterized HAD superfamily protein/hypoxanthine phosphoribosyltransferase